MDTTLNGRTSRQRPAAGADPSTPGPGRANASRLIRVPRRLPTSRAVLGGLLITTASVTTFVLASGDRHTPTTRYAVARRDLAPGELLTADDLSLVAIDLPGPQQSRVFTDPAALIGAVVRGEVSADDLIGPSDVSLSPAGAGAERHYREVSFAVPRARALDGAIRVGDAVDVVLSTEAATTVLTEAATVIAVSGGDHDALRSDTDLTLTLALPNADAALAVAHGGARGELSVLRSTRATDHLPPRYPAAGAPAVTTAPAFSAPAVTTAPAFSAPAVTTAPASGASSPGGAAAATSPSSSPGGVAPTAGRSSGSGPR